MVIPVTSLKGKVLFLEFVFGDYFILSVSVQDVKLTSAIDLVIHKSEMFNAV